MEWLNWENTDDEVDDNNTNKHPVIQRHMWQKIYTNNTDTKTIYIQIYYIYTRVIEISDSLKILDTDTKHSHTHTFFEIRKNSFSLIFNSVVVFLNIFFLFCKFYSSKHCRFRRFYSHTREGELDLLDTCRCFFHVSRYIFKNTRSNFICLYFCILWSKLLNFLGMYPRFCFKYDFHIVFNIK